MRYRYSQNNGRLEKKAVVYSQNEHNIHHTDIDEDAAAICRKLQGAGYETYIVGGAVRDLLLGNKPKDFDIATGARPQEIKRLIRNSRLIGRRFKLVHVFFGDKIIELATFRSTANGANGNTFGPIEEDVMRRDFTMNALFYDPVKQLIIDYVGGVNDIRQKTIKPIIPLGVIFKDDPVRMIRAVKYCALAGWPIPSNIAAKIRANSSLLAGISPSRLTEEITKIIKSPAALDIIQSLEDAGIYQYLQPNTSALFKKDKSFRSAYYKNIAAAHTENEQPLMRTFLYSMIAAYIEQETDWQLGTGDPTVCAGELYKTLFAKARQFVLPMNPPRLELERAIRRLFTEHNITVKKIRLNTLTGRRRNRRGGKGSKDPPNSFFYDE